MLGKGVDGVNSDICFGRLVDGCVDCGVKKVVVASRRDAQLGLCRVVCM